MRVKLNKQYWEMRTYRSKDDPGLMGWVRWNAKEIGFDPGTPMDDRLPSVIHECFHCLFPWMDEDAVNRSAHELSVVLKRLGVTEINLPPKERPCD